MIGYVESVPPFSWWIAAYFTLAGLAGGLAVVAVSTMRLGQIQRFAIARRALTLAVTAISVGAIALVCDLASPKEFWLILVHFNPDSWIAWGARILPSFAIAASLLLVFTRRQTRVRGVTRVLAFLTVVLAVLLAVYPAFVLQQATGRPLWHSNLLPVLFAFSAAHLGLSVFHALSASSANAKSNPRLAWWSSIVAFLTMLALVAFGIDSGFDRLLQDGFAYFLLIITVLGSWILPTALYHRAPGTASVSLLLSGFAMRGWILMSGQTSRAFIGAD